MHVHCVQCMYTVYMYTVCSACTRCACTLCAVHVHDVHVNRVHVHDNKSLIYNRTDTAVTCTKRGHTRTYVVLKSELILTVFV